MDLWIIFLTGLTIGGISCMAVQGGLLASVIAARSDSQKNHIWPVTAFLITKLIAYTALGFLLGSFGNALALSNTARITIQLLAGVYMLLIAMNLLNVHPIFRYAVIQPPRFLSKMVRSESKSSELFAPAFLGALTIFIPCGTTLAMEALAVSSGSGILGALIMGIFTLGASPLFLGIGFLTSWSKNYSSKFTKLAALLVIYFALSSINGSLVLAGSPVTWQTIRANIPIYIDLSGGVQANNGLNTRLENGVQVADITVFPNKYIPDYIQVQRNVPVRLNLTTTGGIGCTSIFTIPQLGIVKNLPISATDYVEFVPPQPGKLTWTCSMGMYTGVIEVI